MMSITRRPGARAARMGFVAAPFLGLALSVVLVWQASYSAFAKTTDNTGNTWTTGAITISDNDSGTALFNTAALSPGATDSRCIAVTSTGNVPSTVRLYGANLTSTNGLSSYLDLVVTQGTGSATGGSCTDFTPLASGSTVFSGTLAGFTATDFAGGYGDWAPTGSGSDTRTFRFTYTLDAAASNSVEGGTAGISFVWEDQS